MIKGKHFYKDGIRFECQGEGKCCVTRGSYGYVYLSFSDRRRLGGPFQDVDNGVHRRVHQKGGWAL